MACATSAPRQIQTRRARQAPTPPTAAEVGARVDAFAHRLVPPARRRQRPRGRPRGRLERFNAMIQVCQIMPNTKTTTRVTWPTMACATSDQNTCLLRPARRAPTPPTAAEIDAHHSASFSLIFVLATIHVPQTADDSARRLIDAPNMWRYGCRGRTHHLERGRCASTSRPRRTRQTFTDSSRARAPTKSTTPRDDSCLCAHSPTMTRRSASRA